MEREANVGERVFDFGAIVEAEAADEFVANATAAEDFFESAGLEVGAVFDGAGLGGIVVEDFGEFTGDEFGFGEGVAAFEIFQIEAGPVSALRDLPRRSGLLATTAPAASRIFCVER